MRREYALSLHDVAPETWAQSAPLVALADAVGAPLTLLVVPHFHGGTRADADRAFVAALRLRVALGDEVVLHGYWHEDRGPPPRRPLEWLMRRVYTDREGEFASLDASSAAALIRAGRDVLGRAGLAPAGFVPPAWLASRGTLAALESSGLRYAALRDALIALETGARVAAPSLVFSTRAAWRRRLSRLYNASRLARLEDAPRVRVALHPADARYPAALDDWRRLVGWLAVHRRPVLESRWIAGPA